MEGNHLQMSSVHLEIQPSHQSVQGRKQCQRSSQDFKFRDFKFRTAVCTLRLFCSFVIYLTSSWHICIFACELQRNVLKVYGESS